MRNHNLGNGTILCQYTEDFALIAKGHVICDEGDTYLRNKALHWTEKGVLAGLASIRDRKVVIMTATLPPYWENVARTIFKAGPDSIKRFDNAINMSGDSTPPVVINGEVVQ